MHDTTARPLEPLTGSNDDPEFRHLRAQRGAERRHSADTYIESLARTAPTLTTAQRTRLAAILAVPPARDGGVE